MVALVPGLVLADRYRLTDQLGVGGMSEVWRGHDEVLGRLVAVKVLSASLLTDAASRDLLRREARAMAQLSHPNVASVHDYAECDIDGVTVPLVVMELLHGHTLTAALAGVAVVTGGRCGRAGGGRVVFCPPACSGPLRRDAGQCDADPRWGQSARLRLGCRSWDAPARWAAAVRHARLRCS